MVSPESKEAPVEEETPVEKEEIKPLNLDEVRDTTELTIIEERLAAHPEGAKILRKIREKSAKVLGKTIVDMESMTIVDIWQDLERETKSVGIHKTDAEKLCGALDSLFHTAEKASYVMKLLEE